MSKALSFGSNSRPGIVAKDRSSGENSVSAANLFLFSSWKKCLDYHTIFFLSITFSLSAMALFDSLYSPDVEEVCVAPVTEICNNLCFLLTFDSLLGATMMEGLLMGFTSTGAEYS